MMDQEHTLDSKPDKKRELEESTGICSSQGTCAENLIVLKLSPSAQDTVVSKQSSAAQQASGMVYFSFCGGGGPSLPLCCCTWAFSSDRGYSLLKRTGFSFWLLLSCCGARALGPLGFSSCSAPASLLLACGIFPDQGSNSCLLHWQADSFFLFGQGDS